MRLRTLTLAFLGLSTGCGGRDEISPSSAEAEPAPVDPVAATPPAPAADAVAPSGGEPDAPVLRLSGIELHAADALPELREIPIGLSRAAPHWGHERPLTDRIQVQP